MTERTSIEFFSEKYRHRFGPDPIFDKDGFVARQVVAVVRIIETCARVATRVLLVITTVTQNGTDIEFSLRATGVHP